MTERSSAVRIGPVVFDNPVFLASGPAGYGLEYADLIDLTRLGAVVTKTITLQPRPGNTGRRLWETRGGLLNSVGLENVGAEIFLTEKLPSLIDGDVRLIVSIAAEGWEEFRQLLEMVAARPEIEAVEINLSCPNVERGGMEIGADPGRIEHYVKHAKDVLGERAVLAKLTPNVRDVARLALAAEGAGADGITAINTVVGMEMDAESGRPIFEMVRAGLSGPAILPIALVAVWKISRTVDIPIVGVGGISSIEDATKFFRAGASAIQIGTAIFYDHGLPERIIEAFEHSGIPKPFEKKDG
ncbi:MAG: dihydroorotate dehydrogenase [bacterium]|nr:MAG: dihydroorotate dehydrogenase [bacterium]